MMPARTKSAGHRWPDRVDALLLVLMLAAALAAVYLAFWS